jgi:hypothetical protein
MLNETGINLGRKVAFTRWSKAWVVVTLGALLAFNVRWLYGVIVSVYQISVGLRTASWWRLWFDYVLTGLVGDTVRLAGVCLALFSVYIIWGPKHMPFLSAKKYVSIAVLCEAAYFLALLPLTMIELARGEWSTILMIGFLLQILLASPVLVVLSWKVWRYVEPAKTDVLKWAGVASIGYLAGIWVVNVFRWFGMADYIGYSFLLSGPALSGFLNSVITLSLAVVFAAAGFYTLLRRENKNRGTRLVALAMITLGLHFAVFLIYSAITNTLDYAILVEIWPVAFLGLGLSFLNRKENA